MVRELEASLGVSLFSRSSRGADLTDAGRALLEEAEAILSALSRLEGRVKRMGTQVPPLRIGFVSAALEVYLPDVLSRVASQGWPLPKLVEASSDQQSRALAAAELDLGLLHPPVVVAPGIAVAELGCEGFCVALPSDHPLTAKKAVASADLVAHPLVLFPKSQGPVLHAAISDALAPFGKMRIGAEAARSHSQLALVAAGVGIGLISASVAGAVTYRGVQLRPWSDRPVSVSLQSAIMAPKALLTELGYL